MLEDVYTIPETSIPIVYPGEAASFHIVLDTASKAVVLREYLLEDPLNPPISKKDEILLIEFTLSSPADTPENVAVLVPNVSFTPDIEKPLGEDRRHTVPTQAVIRKEMSTEKKAERAHKKAQKSAAKDLLNKPTAAWTVDDMKVALEALLNKN